MAQLCFPGRPREHTIKLSGPLTVGRSSENFLPLDDQMVSSRHCILLPGPGGRFLIQDLHSRNGTFVNEQNVADTTMLRHGDRILVGKTSMIFIDEHAPAADLVDLRDDSCRTMVHSRAEMGGDGGGFLPADKVSSTKVLKADYEKLRLTHELQRDIGSDITLDALLTRILDRTHQILAYDQGTILLADDSGKLIPRAVKSRTVAQRLMVSSTLVELVSKERAGFLSVDTSMDERLKEAQSLIVRGIRSTIAAPILYRGDLLGIMIIDSSSHIHAFTEKDLQLITTIADHTAQFVKNSLLHEELRLLFESAIGALAATVDARHPLTAGHSERVTRYSSVIGQEIGIDSEEMEVLKYAALLHDIGKIGIRDHVLLKNGQFSPEERAEMNTHAVKTQAILEKFRFPPALRDVPSIAAHHHEKINGEGYPDGLKGSEIHPLSKIIAVADVFDALTSRRDYPKYAATEVMDQAAFPVDRAVTMISENSGAHFDSSVVDAFLRSMPRIQWLHAATPAPPSAGSDSSDTRTGTRNTRDTDSLLFSDPT